MSWEQGSQVPWEYPTLPDDIFHIKASLTLRCIGGCRRDYFLDLDWYNFIDMSIHTYKCIFYFGNDAIEVKGLTFGYYSRT